MPASSDIGLIGLAVMGQNLALNMLEKGLSVSVFNRSEQRTKQMVQNAKNEKLDAKLKDTYSFQEFVGSLSSPRKIILLVKSGQPVDDFCQKLSELCDAQDIIVDAGNSNFEDTVRRCELFKNVLFVGCGVSGGEEGARYGPAIMPGGNPKAKEHLMGIFEKIAARDDRDHEPCTTWIGPSGSGHFVKMVHNGIEYGDMQIICEAYDVMKRILHFNNERIGQVFTKWNNGRLKSYLIEITAQIFSTKSADGTSYVIDQILDKAGQKGTGKWTVCNALDLACPTTVISESVFARMVSSFKDLRVKTAKAYSERDEDSSSAQKPKLTPEQEASVLLALEDALFCSKISSYAQGFMLIGQASKQYGWSIDMSSVAKIFRNGCIIRSQFLNSIAEAYQRCPELESLYLDTEYFAKELKKAEQGWRDSVVMAVRHKVPVPCMSNALQFFDSICSHTLPANLIQAQRDFFGAHTYELISEPGKFVHTKWTEKGGDVTSSTYNA